MADGDRPGVFVDVVRDASDLDRLGLLPRAAGNVDDFALGVHIVAVGAVQLDCAGFAGGDLDLDPGGWAALEGDRVGVRGGAAVLRHGDGRLGDDEPGARVGHGHRHRRHGDPVVGAARCGGGVRYRRGLAADVAVVGGAHGHRLRGRPVAAAAVGEREGRLIPFRHGVGVDGHRRIVRRHGDRHIRRRVGCQHHRVSGLGRGAAQLGERERCRAHGDAVGLCPCVGRAEAQHRQQRGHGQQRPGGRAPQPAADVATAHGLTYGGKRHTPPRVVARFTKEINVAQAERGEPVAHRGVVISPVQVQGLDVGEQPVAGDGLQGGLQQADVVAVGAGGGPAHRDAVAVRRDRPFPAHLGSVCGIRAGALAAAGGLLKRPVNGDLAQVEAHDAVKGLQRLGAELVEHPGRDPLVAAGPKRGVRHLEAHDRLHIDPRRPRHQPDHEATKAHLVEYPRPVTAQRMAPVRRRQQPPDRLPHSIEHLRLQRAHNDRTSTWSSVVGSTRSPLRAT